MKVWLTVLSDFYAGTSYVLSTIRDENEIKDTFKKDIIDQSSMGSDDTFISLVQKDVEDEKELEELLKCQNTDEYDVDYDEDEYEDEDDYNDEGDHEPRDSENLFIKLFSKKDILLDDNESFLEEVCDVYCDENGLDKTDEDTRYDVRDILEDEDEFDKYLDMYLTKVLPTVIR